MKHIWAILIKFTAIAIVLFSLLAFFHTASLTAILVIAVVTTALAYMIGDLWILPKFGNVVASMADLGLSFVLIWFLSVFFFGSSESILWASFISAAAIAAVEALFHIYMKNHVLTDSAVSFVPGVYKEDMLTEFSEELDVKREKEKQTKENDKEPM